MIKCTCGTENKDNTRFCYKCGAKLPVVKSIEHTKPNYQQTANLQQTKARPYAVCPNCKLAIYKSVNVCPRCNAPLNLQYNLKPTQQSYYNSPTIACPRCNQVSPYGSAFCSQCGFRFGEQTNIPILLQYIGVIIGVLSAIFYGISIFFPYISISVFGATNSASLWDGESDKYIIIGITLIAILFACNKKPIASIVIGVLAIATSIIEMNSIRDAVQDGYENLVEYGFGYYSMILGAIGILAGGIVQKVMDVKTGEES